MVAADAADGSRSRGMFCEMQSECPTVHTKVPASLVVFVRMAKRCIRSEEQLRESRRKFLKTKCELQVAGSALLEAQIRTLSKLDESRSCRDVLGGMEKQLDLVPTEVTSVEAVSAEAAVRSMGELSCLLNECKLSWQRVATAESAVTVLHMELEAETAKASKLRGREGIVVEEVRKIF